MEVIAYCEISIEAYGKWSLALITRTSLSDVLEYSMQVVRRKMWQYSTHSLDVSHTLDRVDVFYEAPTN